MHLLYFKRAVSDENKPLATPVFYGNNEEMNEYYWTSSHTSHHSINIEQKVSIVIFDTRARHGDGFGVYMDGFVEIVQDINEIKIIDDLMKKKLNIEDDRPPEYYCHPNLKRIYKFTCKNMWVNTLILKNDQWIDIRENILID